MKKYFSYILCVSAMQISIVFASNDPSEDFKLYQTNPGAYYDQHSATTDQEHRGNIELLPPNVICQIGARLDFMTAQNYVRALWCTKRLGEGHVYAKNIGVLQIRNRYAAAGLEYKDVFIDFDHPAWKPDALPMDQLLKLHEWFFKADALRKKNTKALLAEAELSTEAKADLAQAFRMFYSAGCLGHMLGGSAAGELLLEPRLNDVIPLIPTYEWLMPGTEQYDIKRLNQPMSNDPIVMNLLGEIEKLTSNLSVFFDSEDEEGVELAKTNKKALYLMIDLSKIQLGLLLSETHKASDENEEIKLLQMLIQCFINQLKHTSSTKKERIAFFKTEKEKMRKYAESVNRSTPFIQSILSQDNEYSEESHKHAFELVQMCLNCKYLDDYAGTFDSKIFSITEYDDGTEIHTARLTPEAAIAEKAQREIHALAILLGYKDAYVSHSYLVPSDVSEDGAFLERSKAIFLNTLLLTRGITAKVYGDIQSFIKYTIYREFETRKGNLDRLKKLDAHFNFKDEDEN